MKKAGGLKMSLSENVPIPQRVLPIIFIVDCYMVELGRINIFTQPESVLPRRVVVLNLEIEAYRNFMVIVE